MDVIIIGKRSFGRGDAPELIYCGQSRQEGLDAVAKTNGEFPMIYHVNPEPFQRINPPERAKAAPAKTPAAAEGDEAPQAPQAPVPPAPAAVTKPEIPKAKKTK